MIFIPPFCFEKCFLYKCNKKHMNKANETFNVSEIISRYILGELTDAEKVQLEQWMETSSRNKRLFDRLVEEKTVADKVQAYARIDRKGALRDLLQRKRQLKERVRRRRFMRVFGYAATILLPLVVLLYFYYRPGGEMQTTLPRPEVRAEIPAGKSKAILQLADGNEVELSSETSRRIVEREGITIKQDSGIIKYKVDGSTMRHKEQFNTIRVPKGGEFTLMLSDGTRVWLNAESRLRFPEEFVGTQRKVFLEGEAYFDVSHDAEKRFIVQTKEAEVRVYGTEFNVSAYEDEASTVATLVKGSISMKVRGVDERIRLKPGEQACLTGGELTKHEVDTENYTAWMKGRLIFNSVRLEDMLRRLARWYNVEIVFSEEALKDVTFTGEVKKYEDFTDILDVIEATRTARFQVKDRTIIVLK